MHIEIAEERAETLVEYAMISCAYDVSEVLDLDAVRTPSAPLPYASILLAQPITKDYDALPGNHPLDWPARFDMSSWTFLAARIDTRRVGGAIVVAPSASTELFETQDSSAVLWDIRVLPAARNAGVGSGLLAAAEVWARRHGARALTVETQQTNVPACRLYAHAGFSLREVRHGAYPELPNEVQLIWTKGLDPKY